MEEMIRTSIAGKRRWCRWAFIIGVILATPVLPIAATTRMYRIAANSMMPSLVTGNFVVANLMSYDLKVPFTNRRVLRWSDPRVGDIILFDVPNGDEGYIAFKRVVAVPGDTIEMRENRLIINGQTATYQSLDSAAFQEMPADPFPGRHFEKETIGGQSRTLILNSSTMPQRSFGPVLVQVDHFFLLGDYRDNSNDSRSFGPVSRETIKGKLIMKAF